MPSFQQLRPNTYAEGTLDRNRRCIDTRNYQMPLQSALITDHENAFLVVAVPKLILGDRAKAKQAIQFLQSHGAGLPVALVTCDAAGAPTAYYGRSDLAIRLLRQPVTTMTWSHVPLP